MQFDLKKIKSGIKKIISEKKCYSQNISDMDVVLFVSRKQYFISYSIILLKKRANENRIL